MFQVVDSEPQVRRLIGVIRANPAPIAVATALFLMSRISQIVTYDPDVKGLTGAAVLEVTLVVAAHALATLTGCWAVISGGRPAGFHGLATLPPGRLGPFLGYAVVFNLWLLALSAVLTRIAVALLDGRSDLTIALAAGVVTAATVLLMYIQLGFLFPDVLMTGQTSIIFAMALGLASIRRIAAALALPVLLLLLPQAILAMLLYDPAGMAAVAQAWPALPGLAAALVVAALGSVGAAACAVAMTVLYRDLTQRLPDGAWR